GSPSAAAHWRPARGKSNSPAGSRSKPPTPISSCESSSASPLSQPCGLHSGLSLPPHKTKQKISAGRTRFLKKNMNGTVFFTSPNGRPPQAFVDWQLVPQEMQHWFLRGSQENLLGQRPCLGWPGLSLRSPGRGRRPGLRRLSPGHPRSYREVRRSEEN